MSGSVSALVIVGSLLWSSVLPICTDCIAKFKPSPPPTPLAYSSSCYIDQPVRWQASRVYKFKDDTWKAANMLPSCPLTKGSINVRITDTSKEIQDTALAQYKITQSMFEFNPNIMLDLIYYSPEKCCRNLELPEIGKMTIEFIWEMNTEVFMSHYDGNNLQLWCGETDIILRSISEDGTQVEDVWGKIILLD